MLGGGGGEADNVLREVEFGFASPESEGGLVVGSGGGLGGVEGPEPHSGGFVGVSDLSGPFPPWPLSNSPVSSSSSLSCRPVMFTVVDINNASVAA